MPNPRKKRKMNAEEKLKEIKEILDGPFGHIAISLSLSEKEEQVVNLHALGKTTPQIAKMLGMPESTVKVYRIRACKKLGIGSYELTSDLIERVSAILR